MVEKYPAIEKWSYDNGFTLEELAWIQPGYPPAPQVWEAVGNDGGIEGRINVMKTNIDGTKLYMAGDFSAVDDFESNSIVSWNGSNWESLGAGVDGEIVAMDVAVNGDLYIVGNFSLNSDPSYTNIAVWDGEVWTGMQQGDMEGEVLAVHSKFGLYVGGSFNKINGEDLQFLAKWDSQNESWGNEVVMYISPSNYDTIHNAFSVNGPVHTITTIETRLLVGGAFTETAPNVSSSEINQISTDYLAYWHNNNWDLGFIGDYPEVRTARSFNNKLYLTSDEPGEYAINVFANGFWETRNMIELDNTVTAPFVHGLVEHNGQVYAYGNIANAPLLGTYSRGFVHVGGVEGSGFSDGGLFDQRVTACEIFQDHMYFAGDFTTSDGNNSFDGLVHSALEGLSGLEEEKKLIPVEVYTSNKELHIEYENLASNTQLKIYNLNGDLVHSLILSVGAASLQEDISHLTEGIFVYELRNGLHRSSGKLFVF